MNASAKTNQTKKGSNRQLLKWSLVLLAALLLTTGMAISFLLGEISVGVLIFALGFLPIAGVSYLETGDKTMSRVLVFVAVLAIVLETVLLLIGV